MIDQKKIDQFREDMQNMGESEETIQKCIDKAHQHYAKGTHVDRTEQSEKIQYLAIPKKKSPQNSI